MKTRNNKNKEYKCKSPRNSRKKKKVTIKQEKRDDNLKKKRKIRT